mmetsp:Transcript_8554/g.10268  ORF Transcript_8554/g.10268 Transcript_8554/m.10268 type:complete len:297 (+) Transcript_8554:3-893(+)
MQEFSLSPAEASAAQEYANRNGDLDALGPAEVYIHHVVKVPQFKQLVNTLVFQMKFENRTGEIEKLSEIMLEATQSIRNSKNLARLLGIVLKVGNELNAGTSKGEAQGVHLSALAALSTTKTNTKKTLLEYIVMKIEKKDPKLLDIKAGLPLLAEAAKVRLEAISTELKSLSHGLSSIESTVSSSNTESQHGDHWEKLAPFLKEASEKVAALAEKKREADSAFNELCIYLGENPTVSTPDSVFQDLSGFVDAVDSTAMKVRQAEERKRKKAAREMKRRNNSRRSSKSSYSSGDGLA